MTTNTYAYATRKEARQALKALDGYSLLKLEGGEWALVPSLYVEAAQEHGEALEGLTPEALEEDVTAFLAVQEEAPEEEGQEEEGQEEEAPEGLTEEEVTAIRTRLQALREEVRELEGVLASQQIHMLVTSTVKGPVALVRDIFLAHVTEDNQPGERKEVVAQAVKAGVAPNTAKTQYQVNRKKLADGDQGLWEELEALRSQAAE